MSNNPSQRAGNLTEETWRWEGLDVSWNQQNSENNSSPSVLLIHGFGACKEHWRYNQFYLSKSSKCFAIDLIGFGSSSKPRANLKQELNKKDEFFYCFDSWAMQISEFCEQIIQDKVILIGNSIGGVIALNAARKLQGKCQGVILIDCAQRTMDDKRLNEQPYWMRVIRPLLKTIVRQRWLSNSLFRNAANRTVIKKVLKQAYPSGCHVDKELIELLHSPSQKSGASEAFRGFINLFDDHLAPDLLNTINTPVDLIWGDSDPWEPIEVAKNWASSISCIQSLKIIKGAGHCPHDEKPEIVNPLLLEIIQATKYASKE